MADTSDQGKNSSMEPDESRDFAARRTVLKGLVAAVPVVLTVTSGEALANASSLQCIGMPEGTNPADCITGGDIWFRQGEPDGQGGTHHCLLYADEFGVVSDTPGLGLNPFTPSCYSSFT